MWDASTYLKSVEYIDRKEKDWNEYVGREGGARKRERSVQNEVVEKQERVMS